MNLVACQFDIQWENRERNFATVRALLADTDIPAHSLIVLPEMFASGFSMNVERIAEQAPSQTEAFLSELAREYESWTIGGLVYRAENGHGSNELSVYGPTGENIGHYQKNHCFSYTGESDSYESGDDILLFQWNGFTVCPTICYDLRFPELFRRGVEAGADLFPVIANWPIDRIHHWETLLKARAIENQAIVMGVNRVGQDPSFAYPGQSMIIDEGGNELVRADNAESCLSYPVDASSVHEWRAEFPALGDIKRCDHI